MDFKAHVDIGHDNIIKVLFILLDYFDGSPLGIAAPFRKLPVIKTFLQGGSSSKEGTFTLMEYTSRASSPTHTGWGLGDLPASKVMALAPETQRKDRVILIPRCSVLI